MKKTKNKFKIGDVVFYFNLTPLDEGEDNIEIYQVTTEKEYLTNSKANIQVVLETSRTEYNSEPVFLKAVDGNFDYGWMPANQVFAYTKAAKLLYANKSK